MGSADVHLELGCIDGLHVVADLQNGHAVRIKLRGNFGSIAGTRRQGGSQEHTCLSRALPQLLPNALLRSLPSLLFIVVSGQDLRRIASSGKTKAP